MSWTPAEDVVRATTGTCPVCVDDVPARVAIRDGSAWLEQLCPEHGESRQRLAEDGEAWAELDRFFFSVNPGSWPQRDYIVRMTERCNLACPICLARANDLDQPDLPLDGLDALLRSRKRIKVDLMAAEPTLRKDLVDQIRKIKANGHLAALHTNGLKLVDPAYVRTLADAGVDEVFLQFDGFDDDATVTLRGRRLVGIKQQALANLREAGLATSLVAVIARGVNEDQVGPVLDLALAEDFVREVLFLGLRPLGRATGTDAALMPDDLIGLACAQRPDLRRDDIQRFTKVFFALLSLLRVRKCLYVQHTLVARDPTGALVPLSRLVDLERLEAAADRYAHRFAAHPHLARAGFVAELAAVGLTVDSMRRLSELFTLQSLLADGMNLARVPRRMLLVGFITACDPANFDAAVARSCGKGELSVDHGFLDSGAVANVRRERAVRG
jgi:pyruvate-formate lyase-activating enzyme